VLILLLLIYCYHLNYQIITLYTEEQDEKGRPLREFYERLGFIYIDTDRETGVFMKHKLDVDDLLKLYHHVMNPANESIKSYSLNSSSRNSPQVS